MNKSADDVSYIGDETSTKTIIILKKYIQKDNIFSQSSLTSDSRSFQGLHKQTNNKYCLWFDIKNGIVYYHMIIVLINIRMNIYLSDRNFNKFLDK